MKVTITVGESSASMDLQKLVDAMNQTEGPDPALLDMEPKDLAGHALADLFTKALDKEYTRFKDEVGRAYNILKELT